MNLKIARKKEKNIYLIIRIKIKIILIVKIAFAIKIKILKLQKLIKNNPIISFNKNKLIKQKEINENQTQLQVEKDIIVTSNIIKLKNDDDDKLEINPEKSTTPNKQISQMASSYYSDTVKSTEKENNGKNVKINNYYSKNIIIPSNETEKVMETDDNNIIIEENINNSINDNDIMKSRPEIIFRNNFQISPNDLKKKNYYTIENSLEDEESNIGDKIKINIKYEKLKKLKEERNSNNLLTERIGQSRTLKYNSNHED